MRKHFIVLLVALAFFAGFGYARWVWRDEIEAADVVRNMAEQLQKLAQENDCHANSTGDNSPVITGNDGNVVIYDKDKR